MLPRRKATKEAWALASSLWGLLSSELAYPVVASMFVIRWSFTGLVIIVAVPTRKDNYTKPVLVCQGDLAPSFGAISPPFSPARWISQKGPFRARQDIIRNPTGFVKPIMWKLIKKDVHK